VREFSTLIAVTRPVSPTLAHCELTQLPREPIDVDRARAQHAAYEQLLHRLGATIVRAPAAPELPDAVFIEDTAVVLDELAVITRPGAQTRRRETAAVGSVLANYRPVLSMTPPATLDGGDVLQVGRTLYVGRSTRTNAQGVEQLRNLLAPFDYRVCPLDFTGCLHLKSAVTAVADGSVLLNPAWVPATSFSSHEILEIDAREPYAANALRVDQTLVYPTQYPRTLERLGRRGLSLATTDCSELAKAEGAVTCCSLVFRFHAEPTTN
jgi:dimethylargininase